jgi:Spy/CpxP family protein refolding chaperone
VSARVTRRLAIALAVSVGLNLFIGGMVTSAWLSKKPRSGQRPPEIGAVMRPLDLRKGIAALGDAERPAIVKVRERFGPALRQQGREMREAQRDVGRLLKTDNLDPAELAAALARLRRNSDAAQETMHAMMVGIVGELTPEQRRRFFEAAIRKPRDARRDRRDGPLERRRERRDGPPPGAPFRN